MPANQVTLIDTCVFLNLLNVPGSCDRHHEIREEFQLRRDQGEEFVLPITTIIETGNTIVGHGGTDRRAVERFVRALEETIEGRAPWLFREVAWDARFLESLHSGDSTGSSLLNLMSNGLMGTGDVSILVERDQFLEETAYTNVKVWTLDANLSAHS